MTTERSVYCPSCRVYHPASVALDEGNYPQTTWLEPHRPERTREQAIEDLGRDAGVAFSIAVDCRRWAEAERICACSLIVNDDRGADGAAG